MPGPVGTAPFSFVMAYFFVRRNLVPVHFKVKMLKNSQNISWRVARFYTCFLFIRNTLPPFSLDVFLRFCENLPYLFRKCFFKVPEQGSCETRNKFFSLKYVRRMLFAFSFQFNKKFSCKRDCSSLLLKLCLPGFLKCFLIFA